MMIDMNKRKLKTLVRRGAVIVLVVGLTAGYRAANPGGPLKAGEATE